MISKKERILWIVYACFLILLFFMSSTNLIIKEKEIEVYPVSVIIEDSKDDYYVNFKKGMEQAASEYNVDISFITLYERNNIDQQIDMISRELNDGARAVILSPVDEILVTKSLDEMAVNVPLIFLNSEIIHRQTAGVITSDFYEMGKRMAEDMVSETKSSIPVYLFTEGLSYGTSQKVYDGVMSVLEGHSNAVHLIKKESDDTYREVIEDLVYPGRRSAVIMALDIESLTQTAAIIEGSSVYHRYIKGLYGIGSTMQILNYLEKDIIQEVAIINHFDAGYLSVQKAVEAIENDGKESVTNQQFFVLRKDDIRKKEYEKMLYPID